MGEEQIRIGIVGLKGGAEFIPLYQNTPGIKVEALCGRDQMHLKEVCEKHQIEKSYGRLDEMLEDSSIDAIHLQSPFILHGEHTIAALEAGKNVICKGPMAISIEDCQDIVNLVEQKGKSYLMFEEMAYSLEMKTLKMHLGKSEVSSCYFMRGEFHKNFSDAPIYWQGLPPMHYATPALLLCSEVGGFQAEYVSCMGSGSQDEKWISKYGSPFRCETAHVKFRDSDVSAEVHVSLFDRQMSKQQLEVWTDDESLVLQSEEHRFTLNKPVQESDTGLSSEIMTMIEQQATDRHGSIIKARIVQDFLSSLNDPDKSLQQTKRAANLTCAGLCAHDSAMSGGEIKTLPDWTFV